MTLNILTRPIHLGLGSKAISQPEFTGVEWYESYSARTGLDGAEGRLVAMHSFTQSWDSWEMHLAGDEVVICIAGRMTIYQEHGDGTSDTLELNEGDYAINPPGTWHTADIETAATALFITAGLDTQHRSR